MDTDKGAKWLTIAHSPGDPPAPYVARIRIFTAVSTGPVIYKSRR